MSRRFDHYTRQRWYDAVVESETTEMREKRRAKAAHVRRRIFANRPIHVKCIAGTHRGTRGEEGRAQAAIIRLRLSRETSLKKSDESSTRWQRGQHILSNFYLVVFSKRSSHNHADSALQLDAQPALHY